MCLQLLVNVRVSTHCIGNEILHNSNFTLNAANIIDIEHIGHINAVVLPFHGVNMTKIREI